MEKFLAEATEVQIVDDYAQKRLRNRWRCIAIALTILVVIVVVVSLTTIIYLQRPRIESNATCSIAFGPLNITNPNVLIPGEIRKQNREFDAYCQVKFNGGNGQWYKLIGQNGGLQASTCDSNQGRTYDTEILVFSGNCQNLECIGGSDQLCGDHASVGWLAIEDMEYYLLVRGNRASTVRDYLLTITHLENNYICQNVMLWESSPSMSTVGSTRHLNGPSTSQNTCKQVVSKKRVRK